MAAVLALTACRREELPAPASPADRNDDAKVAITFPVAIPVDGLPTRTMGDEPDVKNIYVAVFGGSGYFNEWVPAEVVGTELADHNYRDYEDSDDHDYEIYTLKIRLSMSDSRLRLHVMANCPVGDPPITGVSSEDTEDVVMSKVRSQLDETEINDAYWQKIILPIGIRAVTEITNGVEQYKLDDNGDRIPTVETIAQFNRHSPIPLVRNFARVRLVMASTLTDVQIDKFCLAYAPEEGPIAPILPGMYYSDVWGAPVDGESDYKETFFINYQDHPLASDDENVVKIGDAPFNYGGYTPGDLKFGTYPSSLDEMITWSESTYLYVYERTKPRTGQKATRVIIHAKKGNEAWKYYPLDIVDATDGGPAALMRNYTYTLTLTEIAADTGEDTIEKAADATAANVSADPRTADLNEVSDGTAMIATSYIDTTSIKAGKYSVMYRFVPQVSTGAESNNPSTTPTGVTLKFGYNDGHGFVEGANSANGNAFASDPVIETNTNGSAKLYVRSGNGWAVATTAQINDSSVEKWGRINYTTVGTAGNAFDKAYTKVIRVIGIKANGTQIYRDVQVNLIPRKDMEVKCLDKYVPDTLRASETMRIYIPDDLTRSMFPIEFKIQPEDGTLTPRDGDNLPVQSGKSIIPGQETRSAYFFVKTLTRQQYESLPTEEVDGKTLKYFDCLFKTTKGNSATTVYVQSEYFNEDSDDFENYTGRLFTNLAFSHNVTAGSDVNFSFTMDAAHNGTAVWNDAANITSTNKVLPRYVTVTLTGLQPQASGDHLVDERLTRIGNGVYKYELSGLTDVSPTLHLTASTSADSYSVTLSTSEITPNPDLYTPASIEGEIVKSRITNIHFENASGQTITNVLAVADEPVYFCFTYGGAQVPVTFKLNGLEPNDTHVSGSGTYTYTPTASGAQRIALKTTTASMDPVSLTDFVVSSETYNQPSPNSFSLSRFQYSFSGGFTRDNGSTPVTYAKKEAGVDVYFTLNYESDPVPVTFTLTGLVPDDARVSGEGTYTFTPSTTDRTQIIHFKTTDAETTCVLSGLAPTTTAYTNPDPASFSLERRNRRWVTGSYTIDLTDYALYYQTTFTDQVSGTSVSFDNCDYSGDFTYMGTRTGGQGNRRYYNGSYVVTAPSSLYESRITGITMAYHTEGYYYTTTYNYQAVTVAGDVSTSSTLTGDKTTWNSSSTGEGKGDNRVTVTMSCTSRDNYDYRNRLTSLTVHYGYWSED